MLARARRSVLVIDAGDAAQRARRRGARSAGPRGHAARGTARDAAARRCAATADGSSPARSRRCSRDDDGFGVTLADGRRVRARRLLVTTGLADELPDMPGLRERWGRDVLHCPYCHGWEVRDRPIGVLANGPMAVHQALLFRQLSDDVVCFRTPWRHSTGEQAEKLAARGHPVVEARRGRGLEIVDDQLDRRATGRRPHGPARGAGPVGTRMVRAAGFLRRSRARTGRAPVRDRASTSRSTRRGAPRCRACGRRAMSPTCPPRSAPPRRPARWRRPQINADLVEEETRNAVVAYRDVFSGAAEARLCEQAAGDRRHGL